MFTLNFAARFSEDRLEELRGYRGHHARFWAERLYGEARIRTAGPERMRHLEQVIANDGHKAALARRARLDRGSECPRRATDDARTRP